MKPQFDAIIDPQTRTSWIFRSTNLLDYESAKAEGLIFTFKLAAHFRTKKLELNASCIGSP